MTLPTTHDYSTREILGANLTGEHVLVGESGGLCAIYGSTESSLVTGYIVLHTEHGSLYLDPDCYYNVYAD